MNNDSAGTTQLANMLLHRNWFLNNIVRLRLCQRAGRATARDTKVERLQLSMVLLLLKILLDIVYGNPPVRYESRGQRTGVVLALIQS
jgi:hypothetical protein